MHQKIGLITGAASGIGAETARFLLEEKVTLLLVDRPGSGLAELFGTHKNALLVEGDITEHVTCNDITGLLEAEYSRLDILINNAGVADLSPLGECTFESWQRVIDVNLTAVFNLTNALMPLLRNSTTPRVINIGSIASRCTLYGLAAYSASKGAIEAFTKVVAVELGEAKGTCNCILPGAIATPMTAAMTEEMQADWLSRCAIKRLGKPSDIASLIGFLCSESAGYITGVDIPVDGGFLIGQ